MANETETKGVSRRGLFGFASKAGAVGGLVASFRPFGGVAWAAQTPKTYKKWVVATPVVDKKISEANFKLTEPPIPQIKEGECLTENILFNIHSATRDRMSTTGITKPGETDNTNYTLARVLQSRDRTYKEGDIIACLGGWQDHQVQSAEYGPQPGYDLPSELVKQLNGTNNPWGYVFRPVMLKMHSSDVLMDIFGTSGTTAYFGIRESGPMMPGDWCAVAGTTGSVGAMVAQILQYKGCHVIGFGGGPDRAKWVTDNFGIPAIDYRAPDFEQQLQKAFPKGIDFFSDGVSGPGFSEIITKHMKPDSRYFNYGSAGAIYSSELPKAGAKPKPMATQPTPQGMKPKRSMAMTELTYNMCMEKNIKIDTWQAQEHYQDRIEAEDYMSKLVFIKRLRPINTIVDGVENIPKAVVMQYVDNPYGKLQVRMSTKPLI